MRTLLLLAIAIALSLSGCSETEKRQAQRDAKRAGDAVKKELKNDAAFMKEQALKARQETKNGVQKLKKDLNSNDSTPDASRDKPSPSR